MNKLLILFSLMISSVATLAQDAYKYYINLNKLQNDKLAVELTVPKIQKSTVEFSFPKIIPGTYKVSDYGQFVSDVKAFDKGGKPLQVTKLNTNQWKIANATTLSKITYMLDDVFDAEAKHSIYPMAATNFEDANIVLHTPGVFGFINGMHKQPFDIIIDKPANFYGSTALKSATNSATQDVFRTENLNDLYESPIMYSAPDTTSIKVGNAQVLVSVYSPKKQIQSKQVAEWMSELLNAAKNYLGGKLPTDKYAFLFYFKDPAAKHSFPPGLMGALEHPTSSFYYLPDAPAQQLKNSIVDIASHEFFHIITPLTIASKEVKEFNYNEPILSQHLWLYEGATEYAAHHVQAKYGIKPIAQFLNTLSGKITNSRTAYNDALPFTELSKHAAGKHEKEYGNVYQKGALINACLDILLLHLSDGNYGFRNLTYDLGVRYGKERAFNDEELFDEIGKLTYPEVKDFLVKYVAGPNPIPYEYYFDLAGLKFTPRIERQVFSMGGFIPGLKQNGVFFIQPNSKLNEFGQKLGYKPGDELYAFNGVKINQQNFNKVVDSIKKTMKEGDMFEVTVGRANNGTVETIKLSAPIAKVTEVEVNKIEGMPNTSPKQQLVQAAWLTTSKPEATSPSADPADVSSIDAIVKALYDVISGPPGVRNWDRFNSLFLPGAKMGAISVQPNGETFFHSMSTADYKKNNAPFFMQQGFFEQELGRNTAQFGNVATVESAYHFKFSPEGPVQQRGVNYITLAKSKGRWYIVNISWQDETKDNPIPSSLIKK